MGYINDLKYATSLSLLFLIGSLIITMPLDVFIELPSFLWFLENKSLLVYFGEHVDFLLSFLSLIAVVVLSVAMLRRKTRS